jgi:hypothetical protein
MRDSITGETVVEMRIDNLYQKYHAPYGVIRRADLLDKIHLPALPAGTKIDISHDLFTPDAPPALNAINNWDCFEGAVIALHFGNSARHVILGSGVMVAPGIALTARHVVVDENNRPLSAQHFICTGIAPSGMMIWRLREIVPVFERVALLVECGLLSRRRALDALIISSSGGCGLRRRL